MEKYSFFDATMSSDGNYDRTYSSADVADYFASFVGNGVYAEPARSLMVVEKAASNQVQVLGGKAWIDGYYYELDEDGKLLSVAIGDNLNPRIDTVVLALDLSKRLMEINIVKGTPSVSPKPKAPVRTLTRYELVLAEIRVEAGSTKIRQQDITDTRPNKSVCGFVKGVIEQIDTTKLFAQYDDAFTTWFESIQGILEGDVAGNVSQMVVDMKKKTDAMPWVRVGVGTPDNSIGIDGDIYIQVLE